MYVNTGGGGKSQQQQQPLQNQTNVSVRHNNPYSQSHTQQQPHYEHHQGSVTYLYPFCNVAPPTHGNTGGNNVGVAGGQAGHVLFPAPHQHQHQPQTQPHPTQQPLGLHNTDQTLHYFTKGAPLHPHHLHHPTQQHTQLRNMIAAVNPQRQPYMVPPNFFALLPQQSRTPILTNAAPQHAVAAGGGAMATQLQNTAPRSVPPNGPAAYVTSPYCTPPLLLSTAPTVVPQQPGPMLTAATGIVQPPPLQAYAQMGGVLPPAPTPPTPINIQHVGLPTGATSNMEHNTNMNMNINTNPNPNPNTKQRKYAIPIIHPVTKEICDPSDDDQTKPQPQPQPQTQLQLQSQPLQPPPPQIDTKIESNVETISIQTDTDKSLAASLASDLSDVIPPTTCSNSSSALETDKINVEIENEDYNTDDVVVQASGLAAIETTALLASVPEVATNAQSLQSGSGESIKNYPFEDPNDTDADTNEHELDNEELIDATDGNLLVACIEPDLPTNLIPPPEQQIDEVPKADIVVLQTPECDTDHTTETEIKSKNGPYTTISVQTTLDRNDEEMPKEILQQEEEEEDLHANTAPFIVTESKRIKNNRKYAKNKEKHQKNSKQQSNKSNNASTQKTENSAANANVKTAAAGSDIKVVEPKSKKNNINQTKKEISKPTFIRYTLEELKSLGSSSESAKTPVVRCQKGDCISQLFVARSQHHHLSQHGQNAAALQHHVQQSYHQMNFNESIEMLSGKRRSVGGGAGASTRKHQDHHSNLGSSGNNNSILQCASGSAGVGGNSALMQKKMQVICINLSLNEEIKLSECKNAWQPKFLTSSSNNNSTSADAAKNDNDDIEDVVKKVRGILNKLTAENFDVLLKEMTSITINTPEKMQKIMLLIFEKTVSEPNFAPTYAKFCKVLFEEIKAESKEIFNSLLIKRLEKEFESNVNNADAKEHKLLEIITKLNETTDQQEKIELQAELEHQEYQFRRRAWGTVRFIGEMYKLRSLTAQRVFTCVESLLKHGNEEKLEYMCKLLTTVGNLLESSDPKSPNNLRMNKIFGKMQAIIKEAKEPGKKKIKICSRVRFMMQDLIDLRARNWGQSSYAQSSNIALRRRLPDDKNSNLPPSASAGSSYEKGSAQRMSFGNNNRQHQSRSKESSGGGNSGNYYMQKPGKFQYLGQREQQSIDLKKLNFSHGDDSSPANTKLGTSTAYLWRTNTSNDLQQNDRISPTSSHKYSQKHQPQQQTQYWVAKNPNTNSTATKAILKTCSTKDNVQLLNHILEEYLDCLASRSGRWRDDVFNIWQKTNNKQQICLIYYLLTDYLHLANVKHLERNACANIFIYLLNSNILNKATFIRAYEQFAEEFPDLLVDVPNGWTYVFQFIGPLLHERLLKFHDIWYPNWRNETLFTERFVNALVVYFTKEFGANYMRDLWHNEFKLDNGQLFKSNQQQWRQFLIANKLHFLYESKAKPEFGSANANDNSSATIDQHVQRLEVLLNSPNDSNLALDYINTNVNINSCFLQKLTRYLCCDYATTTKSGASRTSSATTSKNSSTCSNTSSSSNPKNLDSVHNVHLNTKAFRNNCLPLLRLCLDGHEDHELACLDSIVAAVQQEYDANTAYDLVCAIFEILYDGEVIAKESFEKWYKLRIVEQKESKIHNKRQLCFDDLKSYMQRLLLNLN